MDRLSSKGSMLDQIDLQKVPHSAFDMSFHNVLSGKLGRIIPIRVQEVLPGDRIKGNTHIVANFEPLVGPIMGDMVLKQETMYIPQSILWKSAHNFFTGKKGFNSPLLSLSYRDICQDLMDKFLLIAGLDDFMISMRGDGLWSTDVEITSWQDFVHSFFAPSTGIIGTSAKQISDFGTDNYVYDLVRPLIDIFTKFEYHYDEDDATKCWIGKSTYSVVEQQNYLRKLIKDVFTWWFGPSSMLDYMGLCFPPDEIDYVIDIKYTSSSTPENTTLSELLSDIPFNWLPFRAAYSCWYWNYRDQLLEQDCLDAEEFLDTDELMQNEIPLLLLVRLRCWFKDAYTTALTNTGNGNMLVPATSSLYYDFEQPELTVQQIQQILPQTEDTDNANASGAAVQRFTIGGIEYSIPSNYLIHNIDLQESTENTEPYYVSLEMIDRARRLSSWISKRLILGTEYDDVLWSSFMVKLSNVRMRVPELLDSSRSTVAINTIVNNTTIPDAQVAGDKAAVAWAENNSDGINYYAEEHGFLLSFMTIMPIQSYPYGMQRMYLRQNRFDFAWPEFAQMGMDAIYNMELCRPVSADKSVAGIAVFGYQGRYYDYKSKQNEVHGRLLTDLHYLTFGRDFSFDLLKHNAPLLNYVFVHCNPSTEMFVVDDPNEDVIRTIDVHCANTWERVLPVPSEIIR